MIIILCPFCFCRKTFKTSLLVIIPNKVLSRLFRLLLVSSRNIEFRLGNGLIIKFFDKIFSSEGKDILSSLSNSV